MSNEIRQTSSTGGQKGTKPQRYDLIPVEADEAISEVYAFGAEKYADHNWRRGYPWSQSYAALQRHLKAFWRGETYDQCPEDCEFNSETGPQTCRNHSGLAHLAHAGFHVNALLTWTITEGEGSQHDDRYFPDGLRPVDQALFDAQRRADRAERALKLPQPDMIADQRSDVAANGASDWDPRVREISAENGWVDAGYIDETDRSVRDPLFKDAFDDYANRFEVNWRTPAVPTIEETYSAMRRAMSLFDPPARFTAGQGGIVDRKRPVTDKEAGYLEKGWTMISEVDGKRIYANPEHLMGSNWAKITENARRGFKHNSFAIRRDPAYDDSWLSEAIDWSSFITTPQSTTVPPEAWEDWGHAVQGYYTAPTNQPTGGAPEPVVETNLFTGPEVDEEQGTARFWLNRWTNRRRE